MRTRLLSVLAFLFLFAGTAAAESKSWLAIKGKVPANAIAVISIDVASFTKSPSFPTVFAMAMLSEPDQKAKYDALKAGCGVDLAAAITDMTVVVDAKEETLVVFGLSGVDEAKALACAQVMADHEQKGSVVSAKKKGKIVEYTSTGDPAKTYVAWLASDVIAIYDDEHDRKKLDKALAGKGAKGDLAKVLGKATQTDPAWFAYGKKQKVDEDGLKGTLKGVFGSLTLGKTIDAKATVQWASAAEATKSGEVITAEVGKLVDQLKAAKLTDLLNFLTSIKATPAGADLTVTGSMLEAGLPGTIQALDKIL